MTDTSRHHATALGVALALAGFVILVLTWKGAAATLFIPAQVAYGASGGLAGLATLGVGLTVLNVQYVRLRGARKAGDFEDLLDEAIAAFDDIQRHVAAGVAPTQLRGLQASPIGLSTFAAAPEVVYTPGTRTYHREGCGLIAKPEAALHLTVVEASAAQLRPCRVCGPR